MPKELRTQVLVVGAGASGIPAAIGAARAGAKVLLIEEDPVIGGMVSDCYVDAFCGGPRTGVVRDAERILKAKYALGKSGHFFLPGSFQKVYGDLLRKANVRVLAGVRAVDVLTSERSARARVVGITADGGPSRTLTIKSDITIDATGTGVVSILAGCRAMYGRDARKDFNEPHAATARDRRVQHCTWMYISQKIGEGKSFDMMKLDHVRLGVHVEGLGWFHNDPDKAMRLNPGIYLHWGCAVECEDTRDPMAVGRAQTEAFAAMERDYARLREAGYAVYLAPRIGVRESNRIVGEHVITEMDLRSGKLPEDTIALGTYGLDIWGEDEGVPVEELRTPAYGLPYRAIVPKGVDGLLLAGKILSGSHVAMSAYRVMPILGSAGQAAGVAAALCVRQKCQPRKLDPAEVIRLLKTKVQGVLE